MIGVGGFRAFLAGSVAAAALLQPIMANAQQGGTVELGEVVVEGQAGGTENGTGVGTVKGVVAKKTRTGSKTATELKDIPQSVSVVGKEQMYLQSPQKVDEALRYVPGVNPSTFGTDADTDWLFVRGFQADQTGIFLDGLSFYQTGFGTFLMDPFFLERIEVVKGPSSALYGGGNPGGFINYVSKRPGERHRYVETGVNSFGNGYVGFDIGDEASPDGVFSYRVNGKVSGGGWETDQSKDLRGMIAPSFKWQPDDATSLTVLASFGKTDLTHTSTGFLPYEGTVVPAPGGVRIPRDFFYGQKDVEQYDRTQAMIGYEFSHTFDNDWTVRQNLRYGTVSLDEDGLYSDGVLTGTILDRYRFAHQTDVNTFTVDNQLEGKVQTGGLDHTLLFGIDYRYYNLSATTYFDGSVNPPGPFAGTTPSIDISNPNYNYVFGPATFGPRDDTTLNQFGVYAQDQIRIGQGWLATFNGRYDFVKTELDRATGTDFQRDDGAFSGRAALAYEFGNGVTPYVSYATAFNPTTSTDGAVIFEPDEAKQIEAGIKYTPTFFDGILTAAVFDLTRSNVIGPSPSNPAVNAAVGEVNVRGLELGVQANLDNGFKVLGGLTYLDAEVKKAISGATTGKTPIQVPDLTASLWLDYTVQSGSLEGLGAGVGVRYVGESWADGANTLPVPDVALLDAAIRYDRDDWGVALNVSNIFDKEYVSSCQNAGFFGSCGYGAGRTFTLKAYAKW